MIETTSDDGFSDFYYIFATFSLDSELRDG